EALGGVHDLLDRGAARGGGDVEAGELVRRRAVVGQLDVEGRAARALRVRRRAGAERLRGADRDGEAAGEAVVRAELEVVARRGGRGTGTRRRACRAESR